MAWPVSDKRIPERRRRSPGRPFLKSLLITTGGRICLEIEREWERLLDGTAMQAAVIFDPMDKIDERRQLRSRDRLNTGRYPPENLTQLSARKPRPIPPREQRNIIRVGNSKVETQWHRWIRVRFMIFTTGRSLFDRQKSVHIHYKRVFTFWKTNLQRQKIN